MVFVFCYVGFRAFRGLGFRVCVVLWSTAAYGAGCGIHRVALHPQLRLFDPGVTVFNQARIFTTCIP